MKEFSGKTALITGASGGLGLECAQQLAAAGSTVVLVARSKEKLDTIQSSLTQRGYRATSYVCDLTNPAAMNQLLQSLRNDGVSIDILVNNAGFGDGGFFAELKLEKQLEMIQLNIGALVALTHHLIPNMQSRSYGRILNVASTAAFQPGPLMATYYATKAFVLSFSEAIANELQGTGVTVTALCPGPVDTGFQATAGIQKTRVARSAMLMAAADVIRCGLDGLAQGKAVVIPGILNKTLVFGVRLLPRSAVVRAARFYQSFTKD